MTEAPDYRSDKMDSREGLGRAEERRRRWEDSVPRELLEDAWRYEAEIRDQVGDDWFEDHGDEDGPGEEWVNDRKERSALVGFWVSWHLAGGFAALEEDGWNRATLFRKVRRFRTVYGAHPDEFEFPYVTVHPEALWLARLKQAL